MKYVLAALLFGVAGLLGLVVFMNIYVFVATADSRELGDVIKPNYVLLATFAAASIVSLAGGVMMLRRQ